MHPSYGPTGPRTQAGHVARALGPGLRSRRALADDTGVQWFHRSRAVPDLRLDARVVPARGGARAGVERHRFALVEVVEARRERHTLATRASTLLPLALVASVAGYLATASTAEWSESVVVAVAVGSAAITVGLAWELWQWAHVMSAVRRNQRKVGLPPLHDGREVLGAAMAALTAVAALAALVAALTDLTGSRFVVEGRLVLLAALVATPLLFGVLAGRVPRG